MRFRRGKPKAQPEPAQAPSSAHEHTFYVSLLVFGPNGQHYYARTIELGAYDLTQVIEYAQVNGANAFVVYNGGFAPDGQPVSSYERGRNPTPLFHINAELLGSEDVRQLGEEGERFHSLMATKGQRQVILYPDGNYWWYRGSDHDQLIDGV